MHTDETFEQFLEKTDSSTNGAVRRVIEKEANAKTGWTERSGQPLCDVESRISFTMPIHMPERGGGGLNYMDFTAAAPVGYTLCKLSCVPTSSRNVLFGFFRRIAKWGMRVGVERYEGKSTRYSTDIFENMMSITDLCLFCLCCMVSVGYVIRA